MISLYLMKGNDSRIKKIKIIDQQMDVAYQFNVSCTYVDATWRFFQSKVEQSCLKGKGKYAEKVKKTRRRNRIVRVS